PPLFGGSYVSRPTAFRSTAPAARAHRVIGASRVAMVSYGSFERPFVMLLTRFDVSNVSTAPQGAQAAGASPRRRHPARRRSARPPRTLHRPRAAQRRGGRAASLP